MKRIDRFLERSNINGGSLSVRGTYNFRITITRVITVECEENPRREPVRLSPTEGKKCPLSPFFGPAGRRKIGRRDKRVACFPDPQTDDRRPARRVRER